MADGRRKTATERRLENELKAEVIALGLMATIWTVLKVGVLNLAVGIFVALVVWEAHPEGSWWILVGFLAGLTIVPALRWLSDRLG